MKEVILRFYDVLEWIVKYKKKRLTHAGEPFLLGALLALLGALLSVYNIGCVITIFGLVHYVLRRLWSYTLLRYQRISTIFLNSAKFRSKFRTFTLWRMRYHMRPNTNASHQTARVIV